MILFYAVYSICSCRRLSINHTCSLTYIVVQGSRSQIQTSCVGWALAQLTDLPPSLPPFQESDSEEEEEEEEGAGGVAEEEDVGEESVSAWTDCA